MNERIAVLMRRRARGFTLTEIMIASIIAAMVAGFVVYITVFAARSYEVLFPQMTRQMAAGRAGERISDLLRNAILSNTPTVDPVIDPADGSDEITFLSTAPPTDKRKKIAFVNGEVRYFPDADDSDYQVVARDLEDVVFSWAPPTVIDPGPPPVEDPVAPPVIVVRVEFKYRKFKGWGHTEADRMNGAFVTRIFPRNPPV